MTSLVISTERSAKVSEHNIRHSLLHLTTAAAVYDAAQQDEYGNATTNGTADDYCPVLCLFPRFVHSRVDVL
jgi:hypothetical protein